MMGYPSEGSLTWEKMGGKREMRTLVTGVGGDKGCSIEEAPKKQKQIKSQSNRRDFYL